MLTVSDKFCKRTIKNTIESIAKQTEKSIFVHELAQKQMPNSFLSRSAK